ncbi:MAG: glycoside hydrolase, partial [Bacteroidota bacterium]
ESQATVLNSYLKSLHQRDLYLCPSFDVDDPLFDSKRYWRGPVWPHMNWMIYQGLKQYGFEETAKIVKADTLEIVHKFGFFEYFEPQKEVAKTITKGYGGDHFSWTASSVIDLVMEE